MVFTTSFSNSHKPFIILLIFAVFCCSCRNNNQNTEQSKSDQTENASEQNDDNANNVSLEAPPENMSSLNAKEQVYAWVDRLNTREKPALTGKVVASATEQEALEFTGEKSIGTEVIVLRGVAYGEPWLKSQNQRWKRRLGLWRRRETQGVKPKETTP